MGSSLRKALRVIGWPFKRVFSLVTGEWLLRSPLWFPNGGGIILVRSLLVSFWIYGLAIYARHILDGNALLTSIRDTIPWLGAILAAVYAAFYARFSSQWTYLAGLYNQIKETEIGMDEGSSRAALETWKAGFIEDAEELHLATKPIFATIIREWC